MAATTTKIYRRPRSKPLPGEWGLGALGPAGVLTGGLDVLSTIGSATITTVFNRAQQGVGNDVIWAIGEALVGGLIAMSVAYAEEAAMLRNISLGVATGGAIHIVNRLIPYKK